jgi:GH35 family endo-1,4-beta-xylanase
MTLPARLALPLVLLALFGAPLAAQQTFELNGFNNEGMQTLSDGFEHELGQFAVRLFDNTDGFGVASSNFGSPVDLSNFVTGSLHVRHNPLAGHGTDFMSVNLFDSTAQSLSYMVDTTRPTQPGDFGMYDDELPLANPSGGSVGFDDFDFSSVASWSITGQPGSAGPFNERIFGIELEGPDPPVEYGGRSLNAAWRAEAAQRIDQNRKADLAISVVGAGGQPLPGAIVHVNQTRQAFQFGTAVAVDNILGTGTNNQIYRDTVKELFNTVTIENALKWVALEGDFGPNLANFSRTVQALEWLQDNGLDTRGHVLIWPGSQNMPNNLDPLIAQALSGDPTAQQQLLDEINTHIAETVTATDGLVFEWDVINEIGTNNDVLNLYGEPVMDQWFQIARDNDPDIDLFINEFNIISDQERAKRQRYLNSIQGLVNRGAEIDGIGFQGHFSATSLTDISNEGGTDPQTVWDVIDMFHDATGLQVSITEYDVNTTNEVVKAEYLRDFLTAVFAHEAVDGFIMWGFWEGRHWRPDAAMFNQDWSETPMVQVWRDLVLGEWLTDEMLEFAGDELMLRAFHGDYEISVEYEGETYLFNLTLGPDGLAQQLVLPVQVLPGDYNGDDVVDAADYTVWRDALGQMGAGLAADGTGPGGTPDGVVDELDYQFWVDNFGMTLAELGASSLAVNVPEPTTLLLGALSAAALLFRRRAIRSS